MELLVLALWLGGRTGNSKLVLGSHFISLQLLLRFRIVGSRRAMKLQLLLVFAFPMPAFALVTRKRHYHSGQI